MATINQVQASDGRPFRRVWIKAFWDFDPENEGFLGFTREGDRTRLFAQYQTSDLILIYRTRGSRTDKEDRGKPSSLFKEGVQGPHPWIADPHGRCVLPSGCPESRPPKANPPLLAKLFYFFY